MRDERGRWRKGESANPSTQFQPGNQVRKGASMKRPFRQALLALIEREPELVEGVAKTLFRMALDPNEEAGIRLSAIRTLLERIDGAPKLEIEMDAAMRMSMDDFREMVRTRQRAHVENGVSPFLVERPIRRADDEASDDDVSRYLDSMDI